MIFGPPRRLLIYADADRQLGHKMSAVTLSESGTAISNLEHYRRELTGYCYRMLGSGFEAEDAVQETMVRAWRGADGFEGRSSVVGIWSRRRTGIELLDDARPVHQGQPVRRTQVDDVHCVFLLAMWRNYQFVLSIKRLSPAESSNEEGGMNCGLPCRCPNVPMIEAAAAYPISPEPLPTRSRRSAPIAHRTCAVFGSHNMY